MVRWSTAQARWGPQADPDLEAHWTGADTGLGFPDVLIGGISRCDKVASATWRMGRSWWFAAPESGTAYLTFQGDHLTWDYPLVLGQPLVIRADGLAEPVLWTGRVDTIRVTADADGKPTTMVSGVDWMAMLARIRPAAHENHSFPKEGVASRISNIARLANVPAVTRVMPSVLGADLPVVNAMSPVQDIDLSSHLEAVEQSTNVIVEVARDGTWLLLPRADYSADPEVHPPAIALMDTESPYRYEYEEAATGRIINTWTFGTVTTKSQASIDSYGRHDFTVSEPLVTASPYSDPMKAALANPLPSARVTIRVPSRESELCKVELFSFVKWSHRWTPGDCSAPPDVWQVLAMEWSATATRSGVEWNVTLDLARTQDVISGGTDETPTAPVYTTVTKTFNVSADAFVVKGASGIYAGNGQGDTLLVGLLSDGNLCRAFLKAPVAAPAGAVEVVSASLKLWTSTQQCMQFGSSPKVIAQRVTSSWAEGSYAVQCGFGTSNAVKWPGPSRTSSGQVVKSITRSEDAAVTFDITAIAKAWLAGSINYGIALVAASEGSGSNRMEFKSRHTARDPVVTIVYRVRT
jgi:hypothetical protein